MSANISTAKKRAGLERQHEPHWQKLSKGVYLGYRVGEDSNTWRARVRDRAGEQHFDSLDVTAAAIELADGDEFDAAKKLCEEFAATILGGGVRSPKFATVGEAATVPYFAFLTQQGRGHVVSGIRSKIGTCLTGNKKRPADPLASVLLSKATDHDFKEWHKRLEAMPCSPQTKNNYLKYVLAGLGRALKAGYACNPLAWACLERFPEGQHESSAYLNKDQRGHYLNACARTDEGVALKNFARGMFEGGARPIDAARARVKDFDPRHGTITFYTFKGNKRESRPYMHPLSSGAVAWLKELTRGKLPTAYLFATSRGGQWTQKKWAKGFTLAEAIANEGRAHDDPLFIPANTRANSWRHSKITDMLDVGRVDSVKVAAQCGTSAEMIRETYYHIIASVARQSLDMISCAA